ncbi:DUF1796 family putative cysteine peptidase [Bacillus paralicheniformis]|nr:DUF1796 family putative cysteine peptidase [Bacillus paralicheniformis]
MFSLGHLCLTAIQLKNNDLRPFSGPLDWVTIHSLTDLNLLLRNRFTGFMEPKNLRVIGYNTGKKKKKDLLSMFQMIFITLALFMILMQIKIRSTIWLPILR